MNTNIEQLIASGDQLTHAAVLLFGKHDPPYSIHIGRFKTPSVIIDDRMIRGTLLNAVVHRDYTSPTDIQIKIFDTEERPGQRTPQLSAILKTLVKTTERWIQKLKTLKVIEFRCSKKTGGYYRTKEVTPK